MTTATPQTADQPEPTTDLLAWLCCPRCRADLQPDGDVWYRCAGCGRRYPIVLGIPDLRICSDPYVTFEQDHEKGREVAEQASRLGFAELLEFYWERVSKPPTPLDLRRRFIRHVLEDEERVAHLPIAHERGRALLDVGCGASAMPVVAARGFHTVFATDVAFRWLVLQRKRLAEAGVTPHVVCCCADHLPFHEETFDQVTAIAVLEHVRDARAVVAECARVLAPGGSFFASTTNRFSLAAEPHVGIWGLGFLPRRWTAPVAAWLRGRPYGPHHLLSLFELRRLLAGVGLSRMEFSLPVIRDADLLERGRLERAGARAFRAVSGWAPLRPLLRAVSPVVQVVAARERGTEAGA